MPLGAVGALDGGGGAVGGGAGLRGGGVGRRGGAVEFVAVGVALRRRARVDAVRVALGGGLGRPPAFPVGLDQVLQRDGSGLRKETQLEVLGGGRGTKLNTP